MTKPEIAAVLTEIGTLMELKGENPFKIRAYQAGARIVESLGEAELAQRIEAGTLQEVKGIGEALAQKITELHTTGRLEFLEKLKASVPPGLVEILAIPGLGPKKVRALQEKLGVDTVAKLRTACAENKVAGLDGFGEKTQEKILTGIINREAYNKRHRWFEAKAAARMESSPACEGCRGCSRSRPAAACAGGWRRWVTSTSSWRQPNPGRSSSGLSRNRASRRSRPAASPRPACGSSRACRRTCGSCRQSSLSSRCTT
jgi:DNA polymerase (family 10)